MDDPDAGRTLPICWGIRTIHRDAQRGEEYVASRRDQEAVPLLRRPDRLRGLRGAEPAEPSTPAAASASPAPQHTGELRGGPQSRGTSHVARSPHDARPSGQRPERRDPTPTARLSRRHARAACRLRQQPSAMGSGHCPDHTSAGAQEPAPDRPLSVVMRLNRHNRVGILVTHIAHHLSRVQGEALTPWLHYKFANAALCSQPTRQEHKHVAPT
jgi:hypothetical protein